MLDLEGVMVRTATLAILGAFLLLFVAACFSSLFHDEGAEQADIERAWTDWLQSPGGSHGR